MFSFSRQTNSFIEIQVDQVTIRDLESNILMLYSRILFYHSHTVCFMPSILKQTDINQFHGCPSRLGRHQGLREQHPDGVQQDSTFSLTDINQFHECGRVDQVTLRYSESNILMVYNKILLSHQHLLIVQVCFISFFKTNQYRLALSYECGRVD